MRRMRRAGLASAVTTYRARSAIRETAKVFGLSEELDLGPVAPLVVVVAHV